ncbi:MAG: hypothetical protein V1809_07545 [Planctomycetota bacterium]
MTAPSDGTARFGTAAHGVRWAASQIPGAALAEGGIRLDGRPLLFGAPADAARDDFSVVFEKKRVIVTSASAVGSIGALLEIARRCGNGPETDFSQRLAFKTRIYKHETVFETPFANPSKGLPPITAYTDRFIEAFFQELVKRHFNAFVIYPGCYHPFEWFLDYEGRSEDTGKPAEIRERNRAAIARVFGTAKRYGLATFMQHYVSHFTQKLSDRLGLGLRESGTRLAGIDHPEVDEYCRYTYRRTFETLPELDGFFLNFESSGNAAEFLKRTLFAVTREMKRKPALLFRLWGISDVAGMAKVIRDYPGKKYVKHKPHDTNDVYVYPAADARIRVWKKALPDVEFLYSIGPCHNCGTNINGELWTDPVYIRALLADFRKKGADSISFQSGRELLLPFLPDTDVFPPALHAFGRMNLGHLDAVVDGVRGDRANDAALIARTAQRFGVAETLAEDILAATVASSRLILKPYWQFCYGSPQEGYLYPGRFSHYQEPFFYYPLSFLNRIGEIPHNVAWRAWAVRTKKIKVVPNNTQAVIDFVNPAVRRKPLHNPAALAAEMACHLRETRRALGRYRAGAGAAEDAAFVEAVLRNSAFGERARREILIAVELYSCYFAKTAGRFFGHLKKARALMLETAGVLGIRLRQTDEFCPTTASGPFQPEKDARDLKRILPFAKEKVPFKALYSYLRSHERYNEIRRLCRPYVSVRKKMAARNRALLDQSLQAAMAAVRILSRPEHALYRDNVMAWVEYVRAEIDWLTPPAMNCPPDDAVGPGEGFRPMVHDQCYRWGENCWEDFSSFYRRRDFFREDRCDCRATATEKGLKISLREHDIDWKEREATWEKNRGTGNQTGFLQILLDPGNTGTRVRHYIIYFRGEGGTVHEYREFPDGAILGTKPSPLKKIDGNFRHTDSSWRFDIVIPWEELGGKPSRGDVWRLNLLSNPAVKRNRRVIWCQAYEFQNDVARLGTLVF